MTTVTCHNYCDEDEGDNEKEVQKYKYKDCETYNNTAKKCTHLHTTPRKI